jgi:hypothetical protein
MAVKNGGMKKPGKVRKILRREDILFMTMQTTSSQTYTLGNDQNI